MTATADILAALRAAGQLVNAPTQVPEIRGVVDDSRQVEPGSLFCAIEGTMTDGHRFLGDAARRGAAAALVTRPTDAAPTQIVVRDGRAAAAIAAREWFGRPGERLRLIGVTGTNGKSTTVALTRHLLNGDGRVGSLGTLGAVDGTGALLPEFQSLTTPGAVELQRALAALAARGVRGVVMEASSHALDQRRLETLTLAGAVYTNLTHDHLDYHETEEAYFAAKAKLSSYLTAGGVEVVNADDPAWTALPILHGVRRISYGWERGGDVRASGVEVGDRGTGLTLDLAGESVDVRLPLLGAFNVHNALAAAAMAWALDVAPGEIGARLANAPQVPGRMERLAKGDFLVVRDYAHTPDALERAIQALRPLTAGRLIVLFGAGGDRDRRKRPLMGTIAARGADVAIVTSDNPRTEDPERIIDDIERGMGEGGHLRITERRAAIEQAVSMLRSGDALLLAGKGHETYQVIGTDRLPFDEREIVRTALGQRAPA